MSFPTEQLGDGVGSLVKALTPFQKYPLEHDWVTVHHEQPLIGQPPAPGWWAGVAVPYMREITCFVGILFLLVHLLFPTKEDLKVLVAGCERPTRSHKTCPNNGISQRALTSPHCSLSNMERPAGLVGPRAHSRSLEGLIPGLRASLGCRGINTIGL